MKRNLVIIILILSALTVFSQQENSIEIIAKVKRDSIVLRWSPTNKDVWQLGNKYGYKLERYVLIDNGTAVKEPIKTRKTFGEQVFKPKTLEEWKPYIENNKQMAVAAGLLYGENFQTLTGNPDLASIMQKNEELNNRFGYSLFLAAQNAKIADFMGLYFVDTDIDTTKKYLYRVYALVPDTILKIDTGAVFVPANELYREPVIADVKAEEKDSTIIVSWDTRFLENFYSAYFIERAVDCDSFSIINETPYVRLRNDNDDRFDFRAEFKDPVPVFDVPIRYRIRGIDYFGELSQPSDETEITVHRKLEYTPVISGIQTVDTLVLLTWDYPEKENENIVKFRIKYSNKINGRYQVIDSVKSQYRVAKVLPKSEANFYIITAVDEYNQEYNSYPRMIVLEDSVPPQPPVNLSGKVDSNGVVTITWSANTENDLYAYKVYRGNRPELEFSEITPDFVIDTIFYDTIPLNVLNSKIYYRVKAFDLHYNRSDYSEILTLIRPDTIPPAAPMLREVKGSDTGIVIVWTPSYSRDVDRHEVIRTVKGEDNWQVILTIDTLAPKIITIDKDIKNSVVYSYDIVAIDDAGNKSKTAHFLSAKSTERETVPEINKFVVNINDEGLIAVKWKYNNDNVKQFLLYRAINDQKFYRYKVFDASEKSFIDKQVKKNNKYSYKLRALLDDGQSSPYTQIKSVNF